MPALALEAIEDQAKQLAHHEQLLLAEHLLTHLQNDSLNDTEIAWLEEAELRYQAYQRGEVTAIPAEEVHQQLRQQRAI